MKKSGILFLTLAIIALVFGGCLTVEEKEYIVEMTGKNSGKFTIKYFNIMSSSTSDTIDSSPDDFDELINKYMNGDELEKTFPNCTNFKKRLYVENDQLNGEVTMEFKDINDIKLFRYKGKGPYMMSTGAFSSMETYESSNGEFGGDNMPVVFWDKKTKKLTLTCTVTKPDDKTNSLARLYKKWEKKNN